MRCTNKSEILFRAGREEENRTPSKWRYLSRSAQCCCWKGRGLSYLPWQRFLVTLFTCGKFCARMHRRASDEDLGSWAPRGQGLVRPWSAGELQVRNNCADHQSRHFPPGEQARRERTLPAHSVLSRPEGAEAPGAGDMGTARAPAGGGHVPGHQHPAAGWRGLWVHAVSRGRQGRPWPSGLCAFCQQSCARLLRVRISLKFSILCIQCFCIFKNLL